MKNLIIILSVLLLSSPVIGQSSDDCFLKVSGNIGEDITVIAQIVRPLISYYISPLKESPITGWSDKEYYSICIYVVTVTSTDGTVTLAIDGNNSPIPFNGLSKSSRSFPENIRHSILRIFHSELGENKKNEICRKYTEILIDECPQKQNMMIAFNKYPDRKMESLMKEPRANLVSGITSMLKDIDNFDFIGISEINTGNDFHNNLKKMMDKKGANSCLVLTTEWDFQKQQTSMWEGLVSMTVSMDSYAFREGGFIKIGSYSVDPQKIPIRKWGKSSSFKKKHLQRITNKITQKWSDSEIINFIKLKK